ncbi:MAG: hypothetical protein CR993_03820 [Rhodobacterales bacterium]|nr:MAG: hypothetical protein CR993_03820 [Rhodobacterales bacterium]
MGFDLQLCCGLAAAWQVIALPMPRVDAFCIVSQCGYSRKYSFSQRIPGGVFRRVGEVVYGGCMALVFQMLQRSGKPGI